MKLSPDWRTLYKIDTADIQNGSCAIPIGVECLGDYAFSSIEGLTEVTFPSSVTQIGTGAFKYCSRLTNITIPPSITRISQSTFEHCTSLTAITIPPSVNFIDGGFCRLYKLN